MYFEEIDLGPFYHGKYDFMLLTLKMKTICNNMNIQIPLKNEWGLDPWLEAYPEITLISKSSYLEQKLMIYRE